MPADETIFANALNLIPELGPVRLARLRAGFGSYEKAWAADVAKLMACGLDEKLSRAVVAQKIGIDPDLERKQLENLGISVLLAGDPDYPRLLGEIAAPPPLLYMRGTGAGLNRPAIAVVGTRKMTLYGKQAAWEIASGLAGAGISVVSGLAFGVDTEALKAALDSGGRCFAVLASPLDDDSISPRSNYQLASDILSRGCLLSEYPLGAVVQKQNFPVRNRIISGLAAGTVVVEADAESGSLITAKYALEQNRLVFAVPGSIFSAVSRGTNDLLRQGAVPVTGASDILRELNLDISAPIADDEVAPDPSEQPFLELIGREPTTIDDVIRLSGTAPSKANALLTMLEMRGRIKNLGGGKYVRTR